MVMIRFQRLGTKKTPHHRIVVTDHRRAQSSRVLEVVGFYDPSTEPPKFSVDQARITHWTSLGAQISESLQHVLKRCAKTNVKAAAGA